MNSHSDISRESQLSHLRATYQLEPNYHRHHCRERPSASYHFTPSHHHITPLSFEIKSSITIYRISATTIYPELRLTSSILPPIYQTRLTHTKLCQPMAFVLSPIDLTSTHGITSVHGNQLTPTSADIGTSLGNTGETIMDSYNKMFDWQDWAARRSKIPPTPSTKLSWYSMDGFPRVCFRNGHQIIPTTTWASI